MIDILFGILTSIAIVKGYRKGIIIALFSIIALIIGIMASLKFSSSVASMLEHNGYTNAKWVPFVSFVAVFILAVLLVNWCGKLIEKTIEMAMLGWLNRIGGIIIYILLYTLIFSVFIYYAEKFHLLTNKNTEGSFVYPYIRPLAPHITDTIGKLIPFLKNIFTELDSFFGDVTSKIPH